MLLIRREQMEALRAPFRNQMRDDLMERARGCFPDEVSEMGDEATIELIDAAMTKADLYRIVTERDMYKLFNIIMLHGIDFDKSPETEWTKAYLTDPDIPAVGDRVRRLYEEVVYRLEVEESNRRIEEQFYGE